MKAILNKKNLSILFFLLPAGILLWHLLLPGYILTLDTVMTPRIPFPSYSNGALIASFPYNFIVYLLGVVFPSWIVQKILMIALFGLLFYIPYRFLRLTSRISRLTSIFVGLFYTINPFVYTRFLAGQWGILFAYALAPLAFRYILELVTSYQEGRGENLLSLDASISDTLGARKLFSFFPRPTSHVPRPFLLPFSLALIFVFSPHIGAMLVIVTAFAYLWRLIALKGIRMRVVREGALQAIVGLVLTSYWTIPALLHRKALVMGSFDASHWEAFKTAAHPVIGTLGNVLTLYGFWGESNPWAKQFYWPNAHWLPLTVISGALLACLILFGIWVMLRDASKRSQGLFVLIALLSSVVFSCGIGEGIFRSFNWWMFEHIPFWQGFRDSQKWTTLIVICYAVFAGAGLSSILEWLKDRRPVFTYVLRPTSYVLVFLYTAPMLFGFSGLLKPVWYPKSWKSVDLVLESDPSCKAIFLPWHLYYSSEFADGKLIGNPAKRYFHCQIVSSENVELNGIRKQGAIDPAYDAMDGLVTGTDPWTPEEAIEILKTAGIHYVIVARDMTEPEKLKYNFLKAKGLEVTDFGNIVLYRF